MTLSSVINPAAAAWRAGLPLGSDLSSGSAPAGDSSLSTAAVAGRLSIVNVEFPIDPEEVRAAVGPARETRNHSSAELGHLNEAAAAQVTAAVALRKRIRAAAALSKRHCVSGPDEL